MEIPVGYHGRHAYHFTHLNNLESIIRNGLLATNRKNERSIGHLNVASTSIQRRRSGMPVPCGMGGTVHDYVPFYFCTTNPMLLSVLNTRNVDQQFIIYLVVSITELLKPTGIFTDASANTNTPPSFFDDPVHLPRLDWTAIDKRSWKPANDEERHHRMAELMIHEVVPIASITHIIVWNNSIRDIVREIFSDLHVTPPTVVVDPFEYRHFYYTKLPPQDETQSLITGPHFFKQTVEETIDEIAVKKSGLDGPGGNWAYEDLAEIVAALEEDFTVLPEMTDIDGLTIRHGSRNYVASDHTREAVESVRSSTYFEQCDENDQNILLLSAYLHGAGKAPATPTNGRTHQLFADYPLDSLKKVARILTDEIEQLTDYQIRKICLLVAYHDLVPDIILHDRNQQQLVDIVEDETELDMLITIGLAAHPSDDFMENMNVSLEAPRIRDEVAEQLASRP